MNTYRLLNKFNCCGKEMVTVIIEGKAACVMTQDEYERLIRLEKRNRKGNYNVAA